jgi:hypothetical protein
MYSADLIDCVLPINSAPDYRDERERVTPKYDKEFYEENVKDYKMHNMINAQIFLDDEIELLDRDALIDHTVLGIIYHPRFPDTFFNYVANSVNGIPILQAENVEAFLNGNYGEDLQQPDCEYLLLILELWRRRYTVLHYNNLNIAFAWIEKKKLSLPAWPIKSVKLSNDTVQVIISDPQSSERQITTGLLPSEENVLNEVLLGVGLLENGRFIPGVKPGYIAGVIRYLIKERGFPSEGKAIFNTLNAKFDLKKGLRTIQYYNVKKPRNILYYEKTADYFHNLKNS